MEGTNEAGAPPGRWRWRGAGLFAAGPLLVLIAFLLPVITGARTWYLRDLFNYHLAVKETQARALREGHFPLVDPFRAGGQALVGNLNNVALYPDNLLYVVAPTLWALNAHLWLHLLFAPLAFYWLARSFGLGRESAWVAGFCYATSGFFLSQLNLYNLVAGTALAPAFAAACRTSLHGRRPSVAAFAAGALLALLILGGDPILAALALAVGLAACLPHRGVVRSRVVLLLAALLCGALLTAPQIVELWRVLGSSYRGSLGMETASRLAASWDPRSVVEIFVPLFFGPPDQRFWGDRVFPTMRPFYVSLYPGLLAIALVLAAGRPRSWAGRWGWWMVFAGGFFALGGWNPVMFLLYRLPLASGLRYPIKAWILVAIGASLLAGLGYERVFARGSRRSLLLAIAGLGLACAAAGVALTVWLRPTIDALAARITPALPATVAIEQVLRWRASLGFALLLLAVAAALVLWSRRTPRMAGSVLLALHVASQLFLLRPLIDADSTAAYRTRSAALDYIEAGERITHGCSIARDCDFGGPGVYPDYRMSWVERRGEAELYPFAAARHGLRYAYNVSPDGLDTVLVYVGQRALREVSDADAVRLLAAAAVDVVMLSRPLDESARGLADLRARLPSAGGELLVYGIRNSAREARLARSVRGGDTRRILLEMTDPGFDPAQDAFLPGRPEGSTDLTGGTAEIESDGWEQVRVVTESAGPGLLVLGRAWLPHWRARVDGTPTATVQANFGQLAVELPPGRHAVELRVDRRPFRAALGGSAVGLLGLLGLLVWGPRRERALATTCHPAIAGKESVG